VLNRLGYAVRIPGQTCCCGALHRHEGFLAEARQQLAGCEHILGCDDDDAVLTLASACHGELHGSEQLAPRVQDLNRFLSRLEWPDRLLQERTERVLVHVPCTQRNLVGDPDASEDLLRRVPGVEIVPLEDDAFCCGAAGAYMLREPALSQALLHDKIERIREAAAEILVTTNTGCALHLGAGIRAAGLAVEVLHPVELLARRLASR
jgi:glycolate oxidase iron-sulfur subunit